MLLGSRCCFLLAGNSPAEAVIAFLTPLQRAVSCVTDDVLSVSGGYHVAQRPHSLTLARGNTVRLQGEGELALSVLQTYKIVEAEGERGPWKVSTTGYFYEILSEKCELITFHWHPSGRSSEKYPHLHFGKAAQVGFQQLQNCHIPTGRISLEEVLRFAITQLHAKPRTPRWDEILASSQTTYERWRTWPSPKPKETVV